MPSINVISRFFESAEKVISVATGASPSSRILNQAGPDVCVQRVAHQKLTAWSHDFWQVVFQGRKSGKRSQQALPWRQFYDQPTPLFPHHGILAGEFELRWNAHCLVLPVSEKANPSLGDLRYR
jgi:hypothetical protein